MIEIRNPEQIHHTEGGWFSARWHFSFDTYRDPEHMGLGPLRVFNDDRLVPGAIWPLHPHRDIEGITYVVEGTFEHRDSEGNGGILLPGAIQRASLGSGMLHSEGNASATEPMRFLQFWILPHTPDLPPSVQQRQFERSDRVGRLLRVAGPRDDDPILVHQDASVHVAALEAGQEVVHPLAPRRGAYAYLIDGAGAFDGRPVEGGSAASVADEPELRFAASGPSELIVVDVPLDWQPVGVWAGRV
jgi:hypothetical protein